MDLKCDARECEYVEEVEEINEDLIGKPCPACGENLLTRPDYDHWVNHVMPAYSMLEALGLAKVTTRDDPNASRIGYHDGTYTFTAPRSET